MIWKVAAEIHGIIEIDIAAESRAEALEEFAKTQDALDLSEMSVISRSVVWAHREEENPE